MLTIWQLNDALDNGKVNYGHTRSKNIDRLLTVMTVFFDMAKSDPNFAKYLEELDFNLVLQSLNSNVKYDAIRIIE